MPLILVPLMLISPAAAAFPQGVASGDVTDTTAILWTRSDTAEPITVDVAADEQFNEMVFSDEALAGEENDLTVKFSVTGLSPQTTYYYRFRSSGGEASEVGRFHTTPPPGTEAPLRFGFSGDSTFAYGPFMVLESAAGDDLDFFIWFGDTTYADIPAGGVPVATDLPTYRAHYLLDRGDPYLRRLLGATPLWVGWDDHEVVDDYAGLDPTTYGSPERLEAAYTAFFEYMPIRKQNAPGDPFRTYRSFRYGRLAEFFLLDARQYREADASRECNNNPDPYGVVLGGLFADDDCVGRLIEPRTMLGPAQLQWLKDGLLASTARYKFVVTGLHMSFTALLPYDNWDGYDAERKELLEFIDANRIEGVWILATNAHMNSFNPDLGSYFRRNRRAYRLGNGTIVREVIAGPIATETNQRTTLGMAEALLGDGSEGSLLGVVLEVAFADVISELARLNEWAFIEPDRYAYALFEVTPETGVTVAFKGISPDAAPGPGGEAPPANTLFIASPDVAPGPPCGLAPTLAAVCGCTFLMVRRRRLLR